MDQAANLQVADYSVVAGDRANGWIREQSRANLPDVGLTSFPVY